jgi:hypothetical protein
MQALLARHLERLKAMQPVCHTLYTLAMPPSPMSSRTS